MSYATVSVIVDGALDQEETFHSQVAVDAFLAFVQAQAADDGLLTEVYVVSHDHPETWDCSCIQYEQDHHPALTFNG